MEFDDTTVAITGASRGLGAAAARRFADEGAHVAICARGTDALASVAEGIESAGGAVTSLRADVRDEFDVERFVETAGREGDGIDVVFANAGVYHGDPARTPLAAESYTAFDDHVRTNARGVFTTVREALPHLNEGARVLVPSGSVAREATDGLGSYAVSKASAEAVARQFAVELDCPVGILDPGQLSTELTGNGPGRAPEDVADMVLWAAGLPDDELDGEVLDLRAWKTATR
ncbi:MAG: SDR family oxidoreductase [Haloarculaceae archaeon]